MKPKSVKSIIEQLRARQALLDQQVVWAKYPSYGEIADLIESGQIFLSKYGKEF